MPQQRNDLLPEPYLRERFHRITVRNKVFNILGAIRKKERLWDREAAIIWLMKEAGYWIEE